MQLADNSMIVLSTTDLTPRTYVAGIQAQITSTEEPEAPQITTLTDQSLLLKSPLDAYKKTSAIIHPTYPNQLCLAVPSTQSWTERKDIPLSDPYLQTYDFRTDRHVSRQALTRNNATVVNVGPRATKLREPDVKLLQISHNGNWLATVEEWTPPESDLEHLACGTNNTREEQRLRLEVYLKFWIWNDDEKTWALETRINEPHRSCDNPLSGRIFGLIADPVRTSFATIGDDGSVRVWRPKSRARNGTVVRGRDGGSLITWYCRHLIELDKFAEALDADADLPAARLPSNGCIAYSQDGSVLVASQEFRSAGVLSKVHFIDAYTGEISTSRTGLYGNEIVGLAVLDRYLVVLSTHLHVWDLVTFELSFGLSLSIGAFSPSQRLQMTHLAANPVDNTFAISLPYPNTTSARASDVQSKQSGYHSEVIVFNPAEVQPISATSFSHIVTALLPARSSKGYVVLDSQAEVCVLTPEPVPVVPQTLAAVIPTEPKFAEDVGTSVESGTVQTPQHGPDEASAVPRYEVDFEAELEQEDDTPVVRLEKLAEIFDVGPSHALPPVEDIFYAVADLCFAKPVAA